MLPRSCLRRRWPVRWFAGCGSYRFIGEEEKKTLQDPVRTRRIFKRCWTDKSELIRLQVGSVQTFSKRKTAGIFKKKRDLRKPEHRRRMLSPKVRFTQSPHSFYKRKSECVSHRHAAAIVRAAVRKAFQKVGLCFPRFVEFMRVKSGEFTLRSAC